MRTREALWSVYEVTVLTGLPRLKIYRMVHAGSIPYLKHEGAVRFRPMDVRQWWDAWIKSESRLGRHPPADSRVS
jgi:excisionase family DNA binding protein